MLTTLDVGRFPEECLYGPAGRQIDLAEVVLEKQFEFGRMIRAGRISVRVDNLADFSFGFAMANPHLSRQELYAAWDDPYTFVWFVAGWGPDRDRYIANAVRKMRGKFFNEGQDTLPLRRWLDANPSGPNPFPEPVVQSANDDGSFPWGTFPWGGAVTRRYLGVDLDGADSTFAQEEDHGTTGSLLEELGMAMDRVDQLAGLPKAA